MKDLIIPVNNEALSRALIAVVGEEHSKVILEAYKLIDAAMVFGYEKSQNEEAALRKQLAEEYVAALERNAARPQTGFKDGYDAGFAGGQASPADQQEGYDDGYVDGVSDARAFPHFADDQAALLCATDGYYEEDVLDHESMYRDRYEGDSGDENDYECPECLGPNDWPQDISEDDAECPECGGCR